MNTIRERLKLAVIHRKTTQVKVAKSIGVAKQEVARVAAGRYKSGRIVNAVAVALGVTTDWLIHGIGKEPKWDSPIAAAAAPPTNAEMLDAISRLTAEVASLRAEIRARDARLTVLSGAMEKDVANEGGPLNQSAREKADADLLDAIANER